MVISSKCRKYISVSCEEQERDHAGWHQAGAVCHVLRRNRFIN